MKRVGNSERVIVVLSTTRAEYSLLNPLIQSLKKFERTRVKVAVSGAHLSLSHGMTCEDIRRDHPEENTEELDILVGSDTPTAVSKSMGIAMITFSDYFKRVKPNMVVILGDRYESLAIGIAAVNHNIPIAHIHGGEITEGVLDDYYRHCLTKLSYLHFTSTEEYRSRVIQMGEDSQRVFNVGSLGVENVMRGQFVCRESIEKAIGQTLAEPFALATFHPPDSDTETTVRHIEALLRSTQRYKGILFVFTRANADRGGGVINFKIEQFSQTSDNVILISSLGHMFLSTMRYCSFLIGNSSSSIIEAPALKKIAINVGDRQKGRQRGNNCIDCDPTEEGITRAIEIALQRIENGEDKYITHPFGVGKSSEMISEIIDHYIQRNSGFKKQFFDLSSWQ